MKSIIIATAVLVGTCTQAVAGTVYNHETVIEDRVCRTVPERQSGYISAGGQTIRLTTPEHQECSYVPTQRIRSTTHYSR